MGHTVLSQRRVIDMLLRELNDYGKALRKEERDILEELLRSPLQHIGSISYASSIHTWAFVLLAIIIEQEKQIRQLEETHARMAHRSVPQRRQHRVVVQNAEWK